MFLYVTTTQCFFDLVSANCNCYYSLGAALHVSLMLHSQIKWLASLMIAETRLCWIYFSIYELFGLRFGQIGVEYE